MIYFQIGSLKDMYLFMLLEDFGGIHMPEKTAALRAEPAVSNHSYYTDAHNT